MTDVPFQTTNPTVILIELQQPFYFFAEPLRFCIAYLLPVIQQFIFQYSNPSLRQFLIPFKQRFDSSYLYLCCLRHFPFFTKGK